MKNIVDSNQIPLTQEHSDGLPEIVRQVAEKGFNRRDFLKGTGALVVSFSLVGTEQLLEDGGTAVAQSPPATKVDSFVVIAADGSVTGFTGKVDLGTGTSYGLKMMLSEELDVAHERIAWVQGDSLLTPDQGATVGSQSIRNAGPTIRRAGAAARKFLVDLASKKLNLPVDQLDVSDGVVFAKSNPAIKATYGELIGGQKFGIDVPAANNIVLKTPDQFKVIGKAIKRTDIAQRILGESFAHNIRRPGMVHGRSIKPPTANAKVVSVDESSVSGVPGLIKVVVRGDFVAVVCEREENALRAAELLKITWTDPVPAFPEQADLYNYMKTLSDARSPVPAPTTVGNVEAGFAASAKTFSATYLWPWQMHAAFSPMAAVADVTADGKCTAWSGGQNPHGEVAHIVRILGLKTEDVRVIWVDGPGVYGRAGSTDDATLEAAILSQAVGRPVRLQWLRADEHGFEPKGPPHVITVKAGVDATGNVLAWDYEDRHFPLVPVREPHAAALIAPTPETVGSTDGSGGNGHPYYSFPNKKITPILLPWVNKWVTGLRSNHNRAPGDPARHMATECFMDELAAAAKVDPLEFRLRQTTDQRTIDVLKAAAERYGWQARPSPAPGNSPTGVVSGRGIAFGIRNTYAAALAEVEVDQSTGVILVKRVIIGHDCGLMINPDSIVQQIEGQVIQTVGRALMEEVMFDRYKVTSTDWVSYPIIKFTQFPQVEAVLINRPTVTPGGVGEPALNPVPAAIGNAVFDATGARLRQVPFTPERVLEALKNR